mmetsp:Transcript_956/g.2990  ORF Transcript_956/g.2990 Transcript_956/m.2990 type:complete len:94 (-) Transcript_956:158-439(-)
MAAAAVPCRHRRGGGLDAFGGRTCSFVAAMHGLGVSPDAAHGGKLLETEPARVRSLVSVDHTRVAAQAAVRAEALLAHLAAVQPQPLVHRPLV